MDPSSLETSSFEPTQSAPPIAAGQLVVWLWDGVEIENETISKNGVMTIHERVRKELESTDADVIIYDHGTGELADFITLKKKDGIVFTSLYHCKGSGAAAAGARVEDLYECAARRKNQSLGPISIAWILVWDSGNTPSSFEVLSRHWRP